MVLDVVAVVVPDDEEPLGDELLEVAPQPASAAVATAVRSSRLTRQRLPSRARTSPAT
jgi:hypothetical protein